MAGMDVALNPGMALA